LTLIKAAKPWFRTRITGSWFFAPVD